MKKMKECQPFSKIPSAVLWDILGRVSIKTCLTCKLVCKEWHNIIVSPKFSSFRHQCNPSRSTLFFKNDRSGGARLVFNLVEVVDKTLDVDNRQKSIVGVDHLIRVEPITDPSSKIWFVWSHWNEGICFQTENYDYFVCNFLTGQCVKLQNLHRVMNQSSYVFCCEVGWCTVLGQFKVLFLIWDAAKNVQVAKIQTMGSGEWRSVGNAPLENMMNGCFLNESSHWCGDNCISCFHFGEEKFSEISLPDDVISKAYTKKNKRLSIFDSCLCLRCFSTGAGAKIDVWIMKEYGVKESWIRQFVIVTIPGSVPIVHMDNGQILVRSRNTLYLYDPQTQVSKKVKFMPNMPPSWGIYGMFSRV